MKQLSKERLEELASDFGKTATDVEAKAMARALLAGMEQEPIGKVDLGPVDDSNDYPDARVVCLHEQAGWGNFPDGFLLYAKPPAPAPDGWVTAPIEPTMKMLLSGASARRDDASELWNANAIYRAMLAAAPREGE